MLTTFPNPIVENSIVVATSSLNSNSLAFYKEKELKVELDSLSRSLNWEKNFVTQNLFFRPKFVTEIIFLTNPRMAELLVPHTILNASIDIDSKVVNTFGSHKSSLDI